MHRRLPRRWLCALAGLLLAAASGPPLHAQDADRAELLRLTRMLYESMLVRQDSTLFAAVALGDVVVVPPGGIVESRAQVIAGLANFRISAVELDDLRVVLQDSTAVVTGRLTPAGEVRGVGSPGPLRFLDVFMRSGGEWRLLARSLTPCAARAVAAGRC